MSEDRYLADHADTKNEGSRLDLLEALYDPNSQRKLAETGLSAGWTCLEVGGGGGSMTRWLSSQVGTGGRHAVEIQ